MKQVVQDLNHGRLRVADVPAPLAQPGQVLIANAASLISAGTEKMAMELARMSIVGKARERPDAVRRVIEKLKNEGLLSTISQVLEKLDEPMTMGYSSAGVVLAAGAGVQEFKPGDRVASNGPHAGVVSVPKHLCARVPDNVPFEQAAFTVLGAIALHGVRLSLAALGETVFVIGLGLVGQITVAILNAAGARVLGTDLDPAKCELALKMGAQAARPAMGPDEVVRLTSGLGADAVIICASTPSHQPVTQAGDAVRKKGRVVAVGAVGLDLPRRSYYFKEAQVVVSSSYGPGRYDYEYEDAGRDYPAAYVRWTEQRNLQAVLELMGSGKLDLAPLISHRFPVADALRAYKLIETGAEPYLGMVLSYPDAEEGPGPRTIMIKAGTPAPGKVAVGCVGAGGFARLVLLPALLKLPRVHPRVIASAGGLTAEHSGRKLGFDRVTADEEEVFGDPEVKAVFIITPHDRHAEQVLKGLRAGRHVFVEKPLALTVDQVAGIEETLASGEDAPLLMVGYNRRFSPAAVTVKEFFANVTAPLAVAVRMNAGEVPPDHWTQDEQVGGGRIIGEACHAIDLAIHLTGSPVIRVFAESIGGQNAPAVTDDQCFITLRHQNGSVSSIAYLAGGDKALAKERVEVFGGGRAAVIDDFRSVTLVAGGKTEQKRGWQQDKGHRAELAAFVMAVAEGGPAPIPWIELRSSALAAILAVQSIRDGAPIQVP